MRTLYKTQKRKDLLPVNDRQQSKYMVLGYYPSLDRIKRELFANLAAAQAGFRDIVADFRKMYGTDNVEAVTRVAGAFVSFRMYTEEYTGTAYVEIIKI